MTTHRFQKSPALIDDFWAILDDLRERVPGAGKRLDCLLKHGWQKKAKGRKK